MHHSSFCASILDLTAGLDRAGACCSGPVPLGQFDLGDYDQPESLAMRPPSDRLCGLLHMTARTDMMKRTFLLGLLTHIRSILISSCVASHVHNSNEVVFFSCHFRSISFHARLRRQDSREEGKCVEVWVSNRLYIHSDPVETTLDITRVTTVHRQITHSGSGKCSSVA
jgi:hypothetical protein